MQWDIGLDFGETGVRLASRQKGVVLCSPSWGAIREGEIIAIGDAALDMLGRNPRGVTVEKPVSSGMIKNPRLIGQWISRMVEPFVTAGRLVRPNLVLSDTGLYTKSEKELMETAALESGAQTVGWAEADILTAIGAGCPVMKPKGRMIVSVGAGVLSACLISYGRIIHAERLPWGAERINHDIIHQVRSQAALSIGPRTAEQIKLGLASALPTADIRMDAAGLDLKGGFPAEKEISAAMVRPAVQPLTDAITTLILCCAEQATEELSADLHDEGVTLAGGGAMLSGLDHILTERTGLTCRMAETPELATIKGLVKVLQDSSLHDLVRH
ncbi:MAG: rod shape-determining protein [Clostridia bacterium]|nr:rod shape-determining protein [Clostridia bacterium]